MPPRAYSAHAESAPARSPTRPPTGYCHWVAGWGSGPVMPNDRNMPYPPITWFSIEAGEAVMAFASARRAAPPSPA